jgi:hypothetical protein
MKVSVLSIASVGAIVALHAAPANAQLVRRKLTLDRDTIFNNNNYLNSGSPPATATKSAKRGTSSPTSDTLTSAKSAKADALFHKSDKASVSTSSPTSDTLGSKSSKGGFGKSTKDKLLYDSELEGFWSGIDTRDGSSLSLSITCDSVQFLECEVTYSDNFWSENYCDGMGVVTQKYTISQAGNLQANKNGPIMCANGEKFDGYPDANEFVVQSNGSLLWDLDEQIFWKTSC